MVRSSFFSVWMKKKEAERDLHLPSKRQAFLFPKKGRTEEHHTNIESPLDHRKSPAFSDKYLLQPPPAYTCQDSGVESSLWTPTPMLCTSAALPTFCLLYLTIPFFLVLLQKQLQDVMSSYYKGNMWVGMSGLWKSTATAK